LIIGATSVFAIGWGVVNAHLVRNIAMDDASAIQVLLDSAGKGASEPLTQEDG